MQVLFKAQILIITQNSQGLRITNLSLFWRSSQISFVFHPFHSYFTCCLTIYLIASVAANKYIYPITTTNISTAWLVNLVFPSQLRIHNSGWLYTSKATLYSCMAICVFSYTTPSSSLTGSSVLLMFARRVCAISSEHQ